MKIKAIKDYFDSQIFKHIKEGEVYDVTPARANKITSAGLAEICEEKETKKKVRKVKKHES